jgi:hypothetical protein
LLVLIALIPATVRLISFPDYPGSDDAFIHLSVIQNIASGNGWGINPGDPVNLSTSPLFTMVFSAMSGWTDDLLILGSVLSVVVVALSIGLTFFMTRRLSGDGWAAIVAAALAATNIHLWRWTGTFLETTFAYCCVLALLAIILGSDRQRPGGPRGLPTAFAIGAFIGLGTLLRPEIGLVGVGWLLHIAWSDRGSFVARSFASFVGLSSVLLPYMLWAQATFGTVTPTSFTVKASSGLHVGVTTTMEQIAVVLVSGGLGSLLLCAASSVFALASGWSSPEHDHSQPLFRAFSLLWSIPVFTMLFYMMKTDALQSPGRYILPFTATIPILASLVWHRLAAPLAGRRAGFVLIAAVSIVVQLLLSVWVNHIRFAPVLRRMNTEYVATMSAAAEVLNELCQPGDTALIWVDLGVVSWRHDKSCFIADGGGLASPDLIGLNLTDMVSRTNARFIVENQGDAGEAVEIPGYRTQTIWSREYLSHSVADPDRVFVARVYRVEPDARRRDRTLNLRKSFESEGRQSAEKRRIPVS